MEDNTKDASFGRSGTASADVILLALRPSSSKKNVLLVFRTDNQSTLEGHGHAIGMAKTASTNPSSTTARLQDAKWRALFPMGTLCEKYFDSIIGGKIATCRAIFKSEISVGFFYFDSSAVLC